MRDYVIAGTLNGKRSAAIVTVSAEGGEFAAEMRALDMLPIECHRIRHGKNVPACWPLESVEGIALATRAGLFTPTSVLA